MKWSDVFFDYHTIAAQKFLRAQKRRSRGEGGVEGQNTGNRYCKKNSLRRVDRKKKKKKRDRNNSDKLFLSRLPECSKKKKKRFRRRSRGRRSWSSSIHNLDVPRPSFVHSLDNTDRRYFPPPSDQLWFLDRFLERERFQFPLVGERRTQREQNGGTTNRSDASNVYRLELLSSPGKFRLLAMVIVRIREASLLQMHLGTARPGWMDHPGQAGSVGAVRNFNPMDDGRWGRPSPPWSEAPRSARRRWGEVSRPWVRGTGSSRSAHGGS